MHYHKQHSFGLLVAAVVASSCHAFVANVGPANTHHVQYDLKQKRAIITTTTATRQPLRAQKDATFGMGCFWKPSEELLTVDGILETTVGYTGHPNAQEIPNYDKVCFSRNAPWVEGVRVVYDDDVLSYDQLLEKFFQVQEPKLGSRQYASIIFPHDSEQEALAQQWLQDNHEIIRNDGVAASWTNIEPLSKFYKAEGYHQTYWQKFRLRLAIVMVCIVLQMGAVDNFVPSDQVQSILHTGADVGLKSIALIAILERFVDKKVEEI